jgi:hypothetical protein
MFDMTYNPDDMIVLAQAQTQDPPALVAPAPNWVSKYPEKLKGMIYIIRKLQRSPGAKPESLISYTENGPLGIPALTWKTFDTQLYLAGVENDIPETLNVQFAAWSCLLLDTEAGQAGAWGPECKIDRFIEMPEGRLETPAEGPFYGDSRYTPVRVGMDKVRFILDNGAGRQVDVTVYIDVREQDVEGDEEESDAENSSQGSSLLDSLNVAFANLSGAALGQTFGDKITLDADAAGHGWYIDYTPYLNEATLLISQ